MFESLEYRGTWWLPNDPDSRYPGTLRFSQEEGAVLDLMGSFENKPDQVGAYLGTSMGQAHDIILGHIHHGEIVTLSDCLEKHAKLSFGTGTTHASSSYHASQLFIGPSFTSIDSIRFNEIWVRYSNLDEWVGISGIQVQRNDESDTVQVTYTTPDEIDAGRLEGCSVSLDFISNAPVPSTYTTEATIKQEAWVRLAFEAETPVNQCMQAVRRIQHFLSLAMAEAIYPVVVQGRTDAYVRHFGSEEISLPTKIYFQLPGRPTNPKKVSRHNMFFTCADAGDDLPNIIQSFVTKEPLLQPAYNLYFSTLFSSRTYLEPWFLSLIQALEVYSRRTKSNEQLPEDEHQRRIEDIRSAVPQEYRQWLNEKLQYSNEPTLRNRILELLDFVGVPAEAFVPNKKDFARLAVDTRNYLTHFNEALLGRAAHGDDLYYLSSKLKLILEICFLLELGFDRDTIQQMTARKALYAAKS